MTNSTDKSILTAAGKALLAQLNAEEKALVIDKMIFANVPNRPEYPQPDDVVPTDHIVHQEQVEQRGRLSADSVIYSTTLTSDVGPFDFNWTGAYCSEYGVLVTIDHHALTPKTADEPGVAGNTLVRSVVLEYKDIAEITNITVDASSWQYNATERMKKMDNDVAQSIIDQNGKDWFLEDGFLVTPSGSAYSIKAGAGYVSGNRVAMEFDRSVQVPNKPSFIYIDAHREGTPTGEQVTLFNFVVTAEEKDDYIDSSTGKDVKHFVCKIAQVLVDGSVSDLRSEGESASRDYVNENSSNAVEQSIGKIIFPSNNKLSIKVGDVIPIETESVRIGGRVYDLDEHVYGEVESIDIDNGHIVLDGVEVGVSGLSYSTHNTVTLTKLRLPVYSTVKTKCFKARQDQGATDYKVFPIGYVPDVGDVPMESGTTAVIQPVNNQFNVFAFGVIGDRKNDDGPGLNAFFRRSREGSVKYENQGGHDISLPRNRSYVTSETIVADNINANIDFGNSELLPTGAFDGLSWHGIGTNVSNLDINYELVSDVQSILENKPAGFRFSGNPFSYWVETVFSKVESISVRYGYYGFALDKNSDEDHHVSIWQTKLSRCRTYGCYDYGFIFRNTSSTTLTLDQCHTFCRNDAPNSQGGREITTSKGYHFYGTATVNLINCSQDGGYNNCGRDGESGANDGVFGNVIWGFVEQMNITNFHLEGHKFVHSDGRSLYSGADFKITQFYVYSPKINLESQDAQFFLFGHNPLRTGRSLTWDQITAKFESGNIVRGDYGWIDANGLDSLDLGYSKEFNYKRIINQPDKVRTAADTKTGMWEIRELSSSSDKYIKIYERDFSNSSYAYIGDIISVTQCGRVKSTFTKCLVKVIKEPGLLSFGMKEITVSNSEPDHIAYVWNNQVLEIYVEFTDTPTMLGIDYETDIQNKRYYMNYGKFDKSAISSKQGFATLAG
ncbi:hypothetical protein THF5H11_90063 [Vibrio jasicida]|uniref:phage tail-collar fiber domain-containing protein n=1 Tax=Vibrio jasicida TaxID=766224 RepID=UPI002894156C|nr:hypothetical protein THF5H11_90063 [Vibrio jasicida]